MFETRNLGVSLGRKQILSDLDLVFRTGEVSVILGPNGSGKSTLIGALSGNVAYDGSVTIHGHEINRTPAWRLAALRGVLAQSTTVAFAFSVAEVVRLGLQSGVDGGHEALIHTALSEVGMAAFASRPFHDLSGGQQARVHLARVRAQVWQAETDGVARWLLLDEPVAALDIAHQLEVMSIMRRFAAAGGGVIAVMHDLNLSAMVADHLVLLADGNVAAKGTPDEVLQDGPLSRAYGCALRTCFAPVSGRWIIPQATGL